jgi:hypothetical protein
MLTVTDDSSGQPVAPDEAADGLAQFDTGVAHRAWFMTTGWAGKDNFAADLPSMQLYRRVDHLSRAVWPWPPPG